MSHNHEDYANLIRKTARSYANIDDALQEAWLCFFEADRDFDENNGCYFATYLQQKLRHHFKKLTRANEKQSRARTAVIEQKLIRSGHSPSARSAARFLSGQKLPRRTATAIALLERGYSLSETARIMKIRPQSVDTLLKRAASQLNSKQHSDRRDLWEEE